MAWNKKKAESIENCLSRNPNRVRVTGFSEKAREVVLWVSVWLGSFLMCVQRIKVGRMERAEYLGVGSEAKRKYAKGLRC